MKITKADLIKMLQDDKTPMDAEVGIYLECTNNDCGIVGTITGVSFNKSFGLVIDGEYEEDGY